MKRNILRVVAALPGVPMLLNGLSFIFTPVDAAKSLGMPLLDGIGRSTQIGDFTAFFIASSIFIFMGAYLASVRWLNAAALLLGLAAIMRTMAYLLHGADLATTLIAAEIILTVWLVVTGQLLKRSEVEA